jgi:hypothetical protein
MNFIGAPIFFIKAPINSIGAPMFFIKAPSFFDGIPMFFALLTRVHYDLV